MFHLAQYNVARLLAPLEHDDTAEFVAAFDGINAIAEATPGFVWRLVDEDGQSSSYVEVPGNDDPMVIVNYSIWADFESFRHFVTRSGHAAYLRRRREWFQPAAEASVVCWWIPAGEIPDVGEAHRRLLQLRADGPSAHGWPFNQPMDPPTG